MQKDIKRIQKIVTREMQQSPDDPKLHYEVGLIAFRAGSAQEGLKWLQSALQKDPNYAPAHDALAVYYDVTGQAARSARHRQLAVQARKLSKDTSLKYSNP
jgi:Tfp pilus assembly protein PilF